MKTKPKSTPLHGAKYHGHYLIVEILLEYGADVNIINDYRVNVYEEEASKEVDKHSSDRIKEILRQYERNLKNENLIDIHVYDDNEYKDDRVIKIRLGLASKCNDLLSELSNFSTAAQYRYFSIALRILRFNDKDTTIISAVACSRYASSKFVDTPIRLVGHKI